MEGIVQLAAEDGGFVEDSSVWVEVSFEPAIDGCGLLARRVVHREGRVSSRVLTLRGYDPGRDRWYQLAVSTFPSALLFEVSPTSDGNWTFITEQPSAREGPNGYG